MTGTARGYLENGVPDLGDNCYENAFVSMYFLRMHGFKANCYSGSALMVDKKQNSAISIVPHSWTGSPSVGVVDFSLTHPLTTSQISVFQNQTNHKKWNIHISSNPAHFNRIMKDPNQLEGENFIFYFVERERVFNLSDIFYGAESTTSPKTVERMKSFSNDLLVKIVIHVYLHSKKERASLAEHDQHAALEKLNSWFIDTKDYIQKIVQ